MSNGITAMWDDAEHYEELAEYFKVPVQFRYPGGMWPYDMDCNHYAKLKQMKRSESEKTVS